MTNRPAKNSPPRRPIADTAAGPTWRELGYFTEAEYAELRGVQLRHLRNERAQGRGPAFTRIGILVLYPIKSTVAHLEANTFVPSGTPTLSEGLLRAKRVAG